MSEDIGRKNNDREEDKGWSWEHGGGGQSVPSGLKQKMAFWGEI